MLPIHGFISGFASAKCPLSSHPSFFLRQDEHDGNNQALCIESTLRTKYILSNWQYNFRGFHLITLQVSFCWRILHLQMQMGASLEISASANMQFLIRSYLKSWIYPMYSIILYNNCLFVAEWAQLSMRSNQCLIKQLYHIFWCVFHFHKNIYNVEQEWGRLQLGKRLK